MTNAVPLIKHPDHAWLESLTYQELVEHFRCAKLGNKFHRDSLGKIFSDTMNAKREGITPEELARIHKEAAEIPREVEGTKH